MASIIHFNFSGLIFVGVMFFEVSPFKNYPPYDIDLIKIICGIDF